VATAPGFAVHELPLLRLRAILARITGDERSYELLLTRFRKTALAADFEGYLAQADAMEGR
jgi:adenylate cyclase